MLSENKEECFLGKVSDVLKWPIWKSYLNSVLIKLIELILSDFLHSLMTDYNRKLWNFHEIFWGKGMKQ